jgi:hypothetical protein
MAFDVITPTQLGQGQVATSPSFTTLRTTPDYARDIVKSIDVANDNASAVTVSLHLVASGGSPDVTNKLVPTVSIPANTIFQWTGTQVISAGATIQANASTTGVTVTVSGGEAV